MKPVHNKRQVYWDTWKEGDRLRRINADIHGTTSTRNGDIIIVRAITKYCLTICGKDRYSGNNTHCLSDGKVITATNGELYCMAARKGDHECDLWEKEEDHEASTQ